MMNAADTSLDEPFSGSVTPTPVAFTPLGNEIVFDNECEEPTRIYPAGALESLLADASPHRHSTVRAMNAVKTVLRRMLP